MSEAPALPPVGGSAAPAPVGLFQFSIEGRRAPALFVTGWVLFLVGLSGTVVGFLSGGTATVVLAGGVAILSIALLLLGGSQTVEREAAGRAYAGPSPVLLFAAIVAVTLLAAFLVGAPLEALGVQLDKPLGDLVLSIVQAAVFIGMVALMVVGPGALKWSDMGIQLPIGRALQALAGGAVFAVPVVVITAVIAAGLVVLFGVTPPSPLPPTGTSSGLVLHLLVGAVVAPISEEIVFRGVAVTAWAREMPAVTAIVRAALLFAFAHVLLVTGSSASEAASLAIVGAAGRLPIALALGWLYLRWGTIWAPIGLHAAFNAILIVASELSLGPLGG
ncbi:MAG TPA: type II CAAX endopeptidase family protein [Candidatus Limnocylindrales bacterium]